MTMKKLIVVVNGKGGVGKDKLCEYGGWYYESKVVSAIDPIKEAARILGWESKDLEGRKFLSDLKSLSIGFNDYPTKYLLHEVEDFIESDLQVLFVHIREPEEISKFLVGLLGLFDGGEKFVTTKTLLVRRDVGIESYGNKSDDNVENYSYDWIVDNNGSLLELKDKIVQLLEEELEDESES